MEKVLEYYDEKFWDRVADVEQEMIQKERPA